MTQPVPHGGGLIAARRRFPRARGPWLDLSTGINSVPYPIPALSPAAFTRLPEPEEVAALEAAAACAYGVADPASVVAAPGSQSLIQLLPLLFPARAVAVVGPTYGEHEAAWAGAPVSIVADPQPASVMIVCNPNNPDGRRHAPSNLLALTKHGLLVVDEAFADFEACSLAPALPRPGLIVLRSFGKAYGLAGLRLGFALADPAAAALIRTALGPWPVSGPAVQIGQAALADAPWRTAAAARLAQDAAALDAVLCAAGCTAIGGTRLFRLVSHPAAERLADHLGEAAILVRRFPGNRLRFGVPDAAGLARLSGSLASAP